MKTTTLAAILPLLPLAHEPATPDLSITAVAAGIEFRVTGLKAPGFGGVLLSLDSSVYAIFEGVPPLLTNHLVLGVGPSDDDGAIRITTPESRLPAGVMMHAQGVGVHGGTVRATAVRSFVLDGSAPR